jgi:hypothetical protein
MGSPRLDGGSTISVLPEPVGLFRAGGMATSSVAMCIAAEILLDRPVPAMPTETRAWHPC